MSKFDTALQIASVVDEVLTASPNLRKERCLYTSVVLAHMLDRADIENRLFQGTVNVMNLAAAKLLSAAAPGPAEAAERWKKANARWVSIPANNTTDANYNGELEESQMLGGHVANMVADGERCGLIDLTFYQFARENLPAPDHVAVEVSRKNYDGDMFWMRFEDFYMDYRYEVIERLEQLKGQVNSDLNPKRFQQEYSRIESRLLESNLITR